MKTAENNGKTVFFDEKWHIYTCNGERLQSVTAFLKKFQKPFDPNGTIAARCAAKQGITKEEMQSQWKKTGKDSADRGTFIHAVMESRFTGSVIPDYDFPDKEIMIAHADTCYHKLRSHYSLIECEKIFFSPDLNLAGTADLVMMHGSSIVIMDFKTNKEFRFKNQWENLLPPFQDYDASHLHIYSLQLQLYRELALRENFFPGISEIKTGIVWIHPEGHRFIDTVDIDITGVL